MSERNKCEGGCNSADNKDNNRRGGRGNDRRQQDECSQHTKRVVTINRAFKVVKGGRRFSLTALVIVGDDEGMVGVGYGKAREVPVAIQKGVEEARKNFLCVPMVTGTIVHPVQGKAAVGIVLLHPAAPGTGPITGGAVRPVLEYTGVQDVLPKPLGISNSINVVHVTVDTLKQLVRPEEVATRRDRSFEEVTLACMLRAHAGQRA